MGRLLLNKWFFVVLFCICGMYGFAKMANYAICIEQFSFLFDPRIKKEEQKKIKSFVAHLHEHTIKNSRDLCGQLKHEFSYIKSIAISYLPTKTACIDISARRPLYVISDTSVLTKDGILVAKEVFQESICNSLHSIKMCSDDMQQKNYVEILKNCFKKLPENTLSDYKLVWVNDTHAWLYSKKQPKFAILFNELTIPNHKLLAYCDRIKKNLEQREVFNKNNGAYWVADIRFEDQIIVFADKGGCGNGSSIFRTDYNVN